MKRPKPKNEEENTVPVVCDFLCRSEKQPGEAVYLNGVWMCYDCMKEILRRHGIVVEDDNL